LVDEVVISGTMKETSRMDCPVAVEVYSSQFFKSNPTASVFEALQNINGVKPQINCNVCNTGDIHLNGLEGPYTMVLIDGMPVVSGLATVYGLAGIPSSLIDRVEIVKGPASTLYGSEAVGGLINIITKKNQQASKLSIDIMGTDWEEFNADISTKLKITQQISSLIGINYFTYQNPADHNNDGFTDVTLQDRISIFQKIQIKRKTKNNSNWLGDMFLKIVGEVICDGILPIVVVIAFMEKAFTRNDGSFTAHTIYPFGKKSLFSAVPMDMNKTVIMVLYHFKPNKKFGLDKCYGPKR
jgi:outer membrane cobalamin receptor